MSRQSSLRDPLTRSRTAGWSLILTATLLSGCNAREDDSLSGGQGDVLGGAQLLDRMIEFHDPEEAWPEAHLRLALEESRPDGTVRKTRLDLHNASAQQRIETERDGHQVVMEVHGEAVAYQVDAEPDVAQELIDSLRLGHDQVRRTRNYYTYLYGLPMKLRDPGTIVDDAVERTEFNGREAFALRVSYDPNVGSDVWIFYADPHSFEMFGYRFFHDELAGDGEYIVLEDLVDVGPLRLPKRRTWYTNQEDELLGTDTISDAEWVETR